MVENINHVIALKSVDIFSEIPYNLCLAISQIVEVTEFIQGEKIINRGDVGDCMYIIRAGSVKVHHSGTLLATLRENEIFGELSLLAPVPRTEDVTALENVVALKIKRAYFIELLQTERAIINGVLKVLVNRIIELNKKIG